MAKQIKREEILRRLKETAAQGDPIIGAGCSVGIVAKCAEAGGADLIIVYSTGLSRIKGFTTTPIPHSNDVTMSMYDEIASVVKDTPIISGIEATESPAARDLAALVKRFTDRGFSGVINFPSVIPLDDQKVFMKSKEKDSSYYQNLEDGIKEMIWKRDHGLDFSLEVEMIRICRSENIFTMSYVHTPEHARAMAKAGVDVMVAHAGGTAGGMAGFKGRTFKEGAELVQDVVKATKEINPDIICLAHGGPFATPEDTRYLYEHTDVAGFVGASSIERIPVEKAIKGVLEEFKSIPLK